LGIGEIRLALPCLPFTEQSHIKSILWHDLLMEQPKSLFAKHRFPKEIIQYAVWLYFVFPLSFRDVELLLQQRGIVVSHEAIRAWCYKFVVNDE
jgi:hypothetical protein